MNQGDSLSWSKSLGTLDNLQKVNGNLIDDNNGVDGSEPGIPNLAFNVTKKLDDSQDISNSELPNGHSIADSTEDAQRSKQDELIEDSEDISDTVLVTPDEAEKEDSHNGEPVKEEDKSSLTDNSEADHRMDAKTSENDVSGEKKSSVEIEESQDIFESSLENNKSPNVIDTKDADKERKLDEGVEEPNSLKLEVTESQFFKEDDSTQDSSKEENENDEDSKGLKDGEEDPTQKKPVGSPVTSDKTEESLTEPPTSEKSALQNDHTKTDQAERASPNYDEPCNCNPSCHARIHSISERLSGACKQLGDFIKLKRRVENPDLANLLAVLVNIESIAENNPQAVASPLQDHAFYSVHDTGAGRKKNSIRSRYESTPLKEPAEKKPRKAETPKPPERKIDFQTIKGLAVFAKWPNSGWYYPGVIEGLSPSDWKEATNVTVTFYDGLVREMKNINILPANLIPAGVVLCDLDDETEMQVISSNSVEDNKVEFKLELKGDAKSTIDVGFHKLAIRAAHMKSIKQVLEPTVDVVPKKMHMVSLDNLVSGRRSRIRTSKEDADEIADTPRKGTRKSVRKATEDIPVEDEAGDDEDAASKATPRRKRQSPQDQSSTPRRQGKRSKQ